MTPTPEQVEAWAKRADAYSAYCSNPDGFERFAALACDWQMEMDAQLCELWNATPGGGRLAKAIRADGEPTHIQPSHNALK